MVGGCALRPFDEMGGHDGRDGPRRRACRMGGDKVGRWSRASHPCNRRGPQSGVGCCARLMGKGSRWAWWSWVSHLAHERQGVVERAGQHTSGERWGGTHPEAVVLVGGQAGQCMSGEW